MTTKRLISIEIDPDSLAAASPDAEHERRVAIFDIIEENSFGVIDHPGGPYMLRLLGQERKLAFEIGLEDGTHVHTFVISLTPFRSVVRDYFMICESYYDAIRTMTPMQIEAIDMARRGLHNEGSELLSERLKGKIEVDFDTSRRLFTLICALHSGQGRAGI